MTKKSLFFFLFGLLFFIEPAVAQRISTSILFKPGFSLSSDIQPVTATDGASVGIVQNKFGLVVPFGGKADAFIGTSKIGLPKFKLGFSQHFLNVNAGVDLLNHRELETTKTISFQAGITGFRAGVLGIWAYSLNFGTNRDILTNYAKAPWFAGGAGKVTIAGLDKWNFYGIAATYNGDYWLPVPLFGMRRKWGKKRHFTMVLPLFVQVDWKVHDKIELELHTELKNYGAAVKTSPLANYTGITNGEGVLQYTYLNSGLQASYRITKNWQFIADGGVRWPSRFIVEDSERLTSSRRTGLVAQPFIALKLRYDFGIGPFRASLFGG